MENTSKKSKLIAASMAGLLTVGTLAAMGTNANAEETVGGNVPCYGVNACKGTGDCGGKGYSCAGKNACKGQGFIKLSKDVCTRIQGGSLTVAS
jgi:uncharacterized membrane protein